MEQRYVRYSANADGSGMTSEKQVTSRYIGIGYMPQEILDSPNLIDNSDFRDGLTYWTLDRVSGTATSDGLTITASTENLNYYRVVYTPTKNPFLSIQTGENLYCLSEAKSPDSSKYYTGQLRADGVFTHSLTSDFNQYSDLMNKVNATGTLCLQIDKGKTAIIKRLIVCKNPVDHWYPSPSDWLADPTNFTWYKMEFAYAKQSSGFGLTREPNPYVSYMGRAYVPVGTSVDLYDPATYEWQKATVRYSANADGSGMTVLPTAETLYIGVQYEDPDIYNTPNLITSSQTYSNRTILVWDWFDPLSVITQLIEKGFKEGDLFTVIATIKVPQDAPQGVALQARFIGEVGSAFIDRPPQTSATSIYPGEEREVVSVGIIPSILTYGYGILERYGRLNANGTGTPFTVQGKCDGIFLGNSVTTWKPSPSNYEGSPEYYEWYRCDVRYSEFPDGKDATTTPVENSVYIGTNAMPREILDSPNLYTGTKDFSGTWSNKNLWMFSPDVYGEFIVASKGPTYNGLYQILQVKKGESYTYSAMARMTYSGSNKASQFYSAINSSGAHNFSPNASAVLTPNGEWRRLSFTTTVLEDTSMRLRLELRETTNSVDLLELCAIKVERGNISTPWTPTYTEWLADSTNFTWQLLNDRQPVFEPNKLGWTPPDMVHALDLNRIEGNTSYLQLIKKYAIRAPGWSTSSPYRYHIKDAYMNAMYSPIWAAEAIDSGDASSINQALLAMSYIDAIICHNGYIELLCFYKKPTQDFYLVGKGV